MILIFFYILLSCTFLAQAQNNYFPKTLDMRQRAEVIDAWLEERVKTVLPDLMRREGIDMWLIIAREYNEDPILKTMLPATWISARRTTILVIFDPGNNQPLETMAMARYNVGTLFKKVWEQESQPDQWKALAALITTKNTKKIGINMSETFAHADGLSATHRDLLRKVLDDPYQKRLTSAENLAVGWLETRTSNEMTVYPNIVRMAHQIIAEGFSEKVIQPGITTTDDLVWWYRNRIRECGFTTWFHPSVAIQRKDPESFEHLRAFSDRPEGEVILPGDLLHVDFGITYLRLHTDTQQHAYVLQKGETQAPAFLIKALADANKVQDLFLNNFISGKTGNEILKKSLNEAKSQ